MAETDLIHWSIPLSSGLFHLKPHSVYREMSVPPIALIESYKKP